MRTTLIRCALTLTVMLAMSVSPALAQSLVKGKVVDPQGNPVEGATVTFEAQGSNQKRDTKTDKKGEFLQVGLNSGTWKVTATKEGVGTQTQTGNVSQGRPVELAFKLAPAAAGGPAAAAGGDAKAQAELRALATAANAAQVAGNYDEAITKFNELVAKVPTCGECFMSLGNVYAAKKDYGEAETAYKKSIAVRETADAYNGLVRIYNDQKKFDLAAEAGGKAASLAATSGGGNAEATYNNGVVLFNAGKFAEAKAQFEAASKTDPTMALAHYYLGMANLNGGDLAGATAAFDAYLKLDPDGSKIPASSPVKVNELKAFLASQKK